LAWRVQAVTAEPAVQESTPAVDPTAEKGKEEF